MNSESYLEHYRTLAQINLFRTRKKTPNTGEINSRRKSERAVKQRKANAILGEGCGGLEGASVWRVGRTAEDILGEVCGGLEGTSVWRVGRTAEDRLVYGRSVEAATSGNG